MVATATDVAVGAPCDHDQPHICRPPIGSLNLSANCSKRSGLAKSRPSLGISFSRQSLFPDIHKSSGRHRIYPQWQFEVASSVHAARFTFPMPLQSISSEQPAYDYGIVPLTDKIRGFLGP